MQGVVTRTALTLVAFAATLFGILHPRPGNIETARAAACSEVTVGAVLSLTGARSATGIQVRNGYEYARRRINQAGGIPMDGGCHNIRVIYYDDESSAGRAADLTERLIVRDRVHLLLGPTGREATDAVATVARRHHVPVVSIAAPSDRAATPSRRFLFALDRASAQHLGTLNDYVAHLAPQIGHEPGDLRMALLHDATRAGMGEGDTLRAGARRLGINIVLDQLIAHEAGDVDRAIAKVKSERPDIVVIDANPGMAGRTLKMLRDMKVEPAILAMADCASARLIARLGEKAEKVLCVAGWSAELSGRDALFTSPAAFADDYTKRAARRPGAKPAPDPVSAPLAKAAVAVRILAAAIERAGTLDHFQVRDALAATDLETIIGRVSFAARAPDDIKATAVIRQISNGRYVVVWPKSVAKAAYHWPPSVPLPF